MMWKAIQGDAIQTARIHLAVHPGNRDDSCSHGKRDLGWTEPEISGTEPVRPLI